MTDLREVNSTQKYISNELVVDSGANYRSDNCQWSYDQSVAIVVLHVWAVKRPPSPSDTQDGHQQQQTGGHEQVHLDSSEIAAQMDESVMCKYGRPFANVVHTA